MTKNQEFEAFDRTQAHRFALAERELAERRAVEAARAEKRHGLEHQPIDGVSTLADDVHASTFPSGEKRLALKSIERSDSIVKRILSRADSELLSGDSAQRIIALGFDEPDALDAVQDNQQLKELLKRQAQQYKAQSR